VFRRLFRKKKKEVKFFVSIGAGVNQLPLIRAAKDLGLSVIAVDQNSSAPGFLCADIRIQESIEDIEEIYTKIQELLLNGTIVAIMTRSYGMATLTVAQLCARTGLQNIPVDTANDLLSKKKMKALFQQHGIPSPKSIPLSKSKKKPEQFPLIVKPVTGHAKEGVQLITDNDSLSRYLKEHADELVIEEFIDGDELIAFGIVNSGRFYLYEITDKITTEHPFFCDLLHVSPSKHASRYAEIKAIGQAIADAAQMINSPLFFEMRVGIDNNIYVIEAAPEFGGELIAESLIPASTGYNIFKDAIRTSIHAQITLPQQYRSRQAVVVHYLTASREGIFSSFTHLSKKLPGLIASHLFVTPGTHVTHAKSNHDRIGVIAVKAQTRDMALSRADEYTKLMDIKIT